ncbi:major facilitator superfamily permease [Agrilactobacillus composti DSM 18527 = JCM 14202]|uniref:Major facilitator superfamily permease n=1 Tax=Agrilactobacillus composti DSM 18527 = JCM 14202 TaxID=1423734 RepID=A0A0R1XYG4_9LACO|nr:MFS transporter [Agrilactobacillus composti]KRM35090.1 major facilitator superfamily permease [Agrilactobacillus composti DSM 18527 = JCM 14202]
MDSETRRNGPWRRNLTVLWFCTFVAGVAFSEISPFLSLYVNSMGNFTKSQVTIYSGLVYGADFLVNALVSPLWGKLADKKGRKIMLLRAAFGMTITFGLMGLAQSVWQMILLRAIQGIFAGYIPNAQALIASQAPLEKSGMALSTLTTGYTSGFLLGPIIGGALAQVFSIRMTFFITAGLLFLTFLMSWLLVKEKFTPVSETGPNAVSYSFKSLPNPKLIIILLFSTLIVMAGNSSISPIISLYVKELMHHVGPITLVAGIIAALPGISNIIMAPRLGRYGDKHGSGKVLLFGFTFATIVYFPQGLILNIFILGFLRLMVGISDAALFPEIQTLLTKNTPVNMTSYIFSWNQSFSSLGAMFGSLLGGFIAGIFDYNAVFIMTALMLFLNLLLIWFFAPEIRHLKRA